jgi:hypothetical protein
MGLLDDAIREHLELKRRNGADPGEIAHEERAALEPVFPGEASHDDDSSAADSEREPERVPEPVAAGASEAEPVAASPAGGAADIAHVSQETAEIDMDELLAHDAEGEAPPEDDLEWETPRDRDGEPLPQQLPGQERLTFE